MLDMKVCQRGWRTIVWEGGNACYSIAEDTDKFFPLLDAVVITLFIIVRSYWTKTKQSITNKKKQKSKKNKQYPPKIFKGGNIGSGLWFME